MSAIFIYFDNELLRNYDNWPTMHVISDLVTQTANINPPIMLTYSFGLASVSSSLTIVSLIDVFIGVLMGLQSCIPWWVRSYWIYWFWWILIKSLFSYSIFISRNFLTISRFFISKYSFNYYLIMIILSLFLSIIIKLSI